MMFLSNVIKLIYINLTLLFVIMLNKRFTNAYTSPVSSKYSIFSDFHRLSFWFMINWVNCDCGACEADVFETDDTMKYADAELKDLISKVFSLIIMFFIIFIICASIILLKIRWAFDCLIFYDCFWLLIIEVIVISIDLMKESIWMCVKRYSMTASVWKIRLEMSELLDVDSGLAVNVWYDAWIFYNVESNVIIIYQETIVIESIFMCDM